MASPQKENGFTSIANEILEKLGESPISGSEFRVCIVVIRKTYGFQKKSDFISLSQFVKYTGLKRANVCRTLKSLVANRLLLKVNNGYSFNKNWEQWVVAKRLPSSQTATFASSQSDNLLVANRLHTKESITKESIKIKEIKFLKGGEIQLPDGNKAFKKFGRWYSSANPSAQIDLSYYPKLRDL